MQTKVNTSLGNTTKTITGPQQPLLSPSEASSMALNFLSGIKGTHDQVCGLAYTAIYYLKAQKEDPDFFVLNFFQVMVALMTSSKEFDAIEDYLRPLQKGGVQ